MRGVCALALMATVFAPLLGAQAAVSPSAQPAAAVSAAPPPSAVVHIDAVITDSKGRAVRDLKPDDFTVVEDGASEKVDSATFVAADGRTPAGATIVPVRSLSDEQAEAARPGARLFGIFLDEYHVAKGEETDRARALLTHFIQYDLAPEDLVVIVKPLDSLISFRTTHDRDALLSAVATFEGRKGDYAPRNDFEEKYVAAAPARMEAVRTQIVLSALNALAVHIGSLQPGRKTLLVVSDGFARPPRRREDASLPSAESVSRNANRAGVSIYAADPRALAAASTAPDAAAGDPAAEHDPLGMLASETDGRTLFEQADAAGFVPALVADASGYYVLSFHAAHPTELRTFHHVELRVKRAGLAARARGGYWAATPDELVRARDDRRALTPLPPPQPMRHASPLIHPWFGVARAPDAADASKGKRLMQVSFVWEAVPPVPGDRTRRGPPAVMSVRALEETDGTAVFTGEVRPTTAAAGARQDAPNEGAFLTPPGRLLLMMNVEDADGNVLDTDVRDVIVGGLAGPVEVGTPEVLRAENARELRELEAATDPVPVAARDFTHADHLLVRLPVYGGDSPLAVTASLTTPQGRVMRALPVAPVPGTILYQADVSLAGLVTGDYLIAIQASGPAGKAADAVPFRIVP